MYTLQLFRISFTPSFFAICAASASDSVIGLGAIFVLSFGQKFASRSRSFQYWVACAEAAKAKSALSAAAQRDNRTQRERGTRKRRSMGSRSEEGWPTRGRADPAVNGQAVINESQSQQPQ